MEATNLEPNICVKCNQVIDGEKLGYIPVPGYKNHCIYCYHCCALWDKSQMEKSDRYYLYLKTGITGNNTPYTVINWPGTLEFPVTRAKTHSKKYTPRGGSYQLTYVWFQDHKGNDWIGMNNGNDDTLKCKKLKAKKKS